MTAVANATFTAAQFNTFVRDNLNETAPAKATTSGGYFVSTGVNTLAERIFAGDYVDTSQTTTSTTFTDLATAGPAVTVTTSIRALIVVTAEVSNSGAGNTSFMGHAVSGASTVAATDTAALYFRSPGAGDLMAASYVVSRVGDLTPGSNTFTAKYRVTAGTGTFFRRRIFVMPF